jgi:hypothetical protein
MQAMAPIFSHHNLVSSKGPDLALSRLNRNARASAAIGGKADPDYTTLAELDFFGT